MRYSVAALLIIGLLVASCASLGIGSDREAEPAEDERSRLADRVAEYESFDPSPYRDSAPRTTVTVDHQVPEQLMQGTAVEGIRRTVEGYRIQIFSTQEKRIADQKLEETLDWWERAQSRAPEDLFQEELSAVIEYGQPYYRVRVGAFENRDRAEEALEFIKEQYPDAFLARTTVTVTE